MEKIITVTERALRKAVQTRVAEPDADDLALWLEATPAGGFQWAYDLFLDVQENIRPKDYVQSEDGITLVVPEALIGNIRGATLDLSKDLLNPGWIVDNPNVPVPTPVGGLDPKTLTGTVEERVSKVLEQVINPSIASHGGKAQLDRVEGSTAYLVLSGGCQGCGMAAATLAHGIKVALTQAVPEIEEVVDATDHASGKTPYYASH